MAALQEVDRHRKERADYDDQAARLEELVWMNARYGVALAADHSLVLADLALSGEPPAAESVLEPTGVEYAMSNPVPSEAEDLLTSEPLMAHFATCADGRPHVAPVWYHYDDGVLEVLTTGRKLANVRENPRVAVSVQKDEGGRAQWMVTLRGTATVVEDEAEHRAAAERINPKYGADPEEYSENVLVRVDVGSANYQTY